MLYEVITIIFLLYQNVFLVKMGKKWVFWTGFYFHAQIKFKLLDTHLEAIIKMVNNCQTDRVIEKITRRIGKVSVIKINPHFNPFDNELPYRSGVGSSNSSSGYRRDSSPPDGWESLFPEMGNPENIPSQSALEFEGFGHVDEKLPSYNFV